MWLVSFSNPSFFLWLNRLLALGCIMKKVTWDEMSLTVTLSLKGSPLADAVKWHFHPAIHFLDRFYSLRGSHSLIRPLLGEGRVHPGQVWPF